jgi:dihydrofolate synthase / folylpolyglutamate synthase
VQFDNAAAVLAVLHELRPRLPLAAEAIADGLRTVALPGRFQMLAAYDRNWILDVAHNPAAAKELAATLQRTTLPCGARTVAVCAMFADKDFAGVVAALRPQVDIWVLTTLPGARALPAEQLAQTVAAQGAEAMLAGDVAAACEQARQLAQSCDRIVVFGSFYTVGPALEWLSQAG